MAAQLTSTNGPGGPGAGAVKRAGEESLADAGLALDQNGGQPPRSAWRWSNRAAVSRTATIPGLSPSSSARREGAMGRLSYPEVRGTSTAPESQPRY